MSAVPATADGAPPRDPARTITVGAAQPGPIQRDHTRADVVERLLVLLRRGRGRSLRFLVGFMVAGALVSSLLLWRWGAGVPDPSDAY